MTKLQRLKEESSLLTHRQKEELMAHLMVGAAQDWDPKAKKAWLKEIKRRDALLRSGQMRTRSHEDVMADLRATLR
jgi:hypothetical protein